MTTLASSETATAAPRMLDGIRSPADIKALNEEDLPQLAQEVRDQLTKVLSQTGGHLGPNLGVVEMTIALDRVFETPKDRFVVDVRHQGYVHKMFTGRLDRIATMRQYQGLNGFLLRTESKHDCYGAGHAGTALSAGLGMAVGRDLRGGNENVVVVAGDAAFTCGISYEALNNAKSQTRRFIVVLNDNEWSIAKNVGAIASYLNNIGANPTYAGLHDKARRFIEAIAGKSAVEFAHRFEEGVKNLLVPSVIFEELGLRYYGPIDGHDIPLLISTFEFLKTQDEPVLLHILTKKGKGYEPAIAKPDKFHGLGKYKIESGETAPAPTPTYSELMGKTLAKFADSNQKIVAITAAMPSGTGLGFFQAQHPTRYFDVGIAEEHAALFACGLATQGLSPESSAKTARDRQSRSGATWPRGGHFRIGQHVRSGGRSGAQARRKRHLGRAHQSAVDQTARHRHARIFRARRGGGLHHRGPRAAQRFRMRGHGASPQPDDP